MRVRESEPGGAEREEESEVEIKGGGEEHLGLPLESSVMREGSVPRPISLH